MPDNKQYICVRAWRRHSLGTIITEWEYNKLPHEIKDGNHFKVHVPVVQVNKSKYGEEDKPATEPQPTKAQNDFRSIKRHNLQQGFVGDTDRSGSEEVPTVHD